MAETFRIGKIKVLINRLSIKRIALEERSKHKEFTDMKLYIKGQIQSLDEVLATLRDEFNIEGDI